MNVGLSRYPLVGLEGISRYRHRFSPSYMSPRTRSSVLWNPRPSPLETCLFSIWHSSMESLNLRLLLRDTPGLGSPIEDPSHSLLSWGNCKLLTLNFSGPRRRVFLETLRRRCVSRGEESRSLSSFWRDTSRTWSYTSLEWVGSAKGSRVPSFNLVGIKETGVFSVSAPVLTGTRTTLLPMCPVGYTRITTPSAVQTFTVVTSVDPVSGCRFWTVVLFHPKSSTSFRRWWGVLQEGEGRQKPLLSI